ncbi:MAG: DUF2058 family protein [Planctomycetota bacterium]
MSLRDQLKKAKLLSDKDARRLAHESRVERKEKGREQLEQEQEQKQQELQRLQGEERARVQREQKELEQARLQREEGAAVQAILDKARKAGPGTVKWYFETEDGALPWLEVSPREAQELRAGMQFVVSLGASGTHDYRLLDGELAQRVAKVRPEAIAWAAKGALRR